jgi:hypothetical protein
MSKRSSAAASTFLAAAVLVSILAGCSNHPRLTQPGLERGAVAAGIEPGQTLASGAEVFPLVVGNRWRYRGLIVEEAIFDPAPTFRSERRYRLHADLLCAERLGERTYVVGRERQMLQGGAEYATWIRYRQDGSGLYELDPPGGAPECGDPTRSDTGADAGVADITPGSRVIEDAEKQAAYERTRAELLSRLERVRSAIARAAASRGGSATPEGITPSEIQRLAYPLRIGQSWEIRHDPLFASRVVAHESLQLPAGRLAGWKVQITSELFGPDDRVFFWVSRLGFLQYDFRLSGDLVDKGGAVIGELRFHEHRELFDYALQGPGRSGEPHPTPEPVATR